MPKTSKRRHETDSDTDSSSSSEAEESTIVPKQKRKQGYLAAYSQKWSCLTSSKKGPEFVHCTICNIPFSCAHGGGNDCKKHVKSQADQKLLRDSKGTRSIADAFSAQSSKSVEDLSLQTTAAEVSMCKIVAENNLSLSFAERFIQKLKKMLPDSKIAQGMTLGRSKATVMIKEMSAQAMKELSREMKARPFSLATDGSNEGDKKQFPLVIRSFSKDEHGNLGPVTTQLLSFRNCEGSATGKNIFDLVDAELTAHEIPWDKCLAFGSDNAPVMTGKNKGVFAFITEKNKNVYLAACTLHLVHIAAKKGVACLPPVEEILIDIYYYFKKSTLRQANLKEYQELYDVEQEAMLKHGCTRWLSIARCIKRLLKNWEPLRKFFIEEEKSKKKADQKKEKKAQSTATKEEEDSTTGASSKKISTIVCFLKSPTNKLYTVFLDYTLKVYDGVLVKLQAEKPLIHELHDTLTKLLKDLFSRFMTPAAVLGKEVTDVEFHNREKQKEDKDLLIGSEAREMLKDPEKHYLRDERVQEFFDNVRRYFESTCDYLLQKLPLKDPLLQHIHVVDPEKQLTATQEDLDFFLNRFPCLLPPEASVETITEQFSSYQMTEVTDCIGDTVDSSWVAISKAHPDLKPLCEVMLGICTIPHSSAACERVFSCVRKTFTEQRTSLAQDTLEALLVLKAQPDKPRTTEQLMHLKSCYSVHQDQYKKKN